MKIGILGGSFDPPHNGHIAIAEAAMAQLELDQVIFIPAHRNPLKETAPRASSQQRLEMTRLAISEHESFAVSDQEIVRRGPSYTVETLDELHAVRPADYWLIVGLDAITSFNEWRSSQRILKLARIALVNRGTSSEASVISRVPEDIRQFVDLVMTSPIEVSSTEVRERIRDGKPYTPLVPSSVARYIKDNRLYTQR